MINKLYDKIKKIISENYKYFLSLLLTVIVLTIEFPYYVNTPGGVMSVQDKIKINNNYIDNDFFNLAYVLELKGNIPNLILGKLKKDWDIVKKEEVIASNENVSEANFRNHILLEEANQNAIIVAYNLALEEIKINNRQLFVIYIDETASTDLKIEDEIISINGQIINSKEDITNIVNNLNVGDKLNIKVKNNNQTINRYAYIKDVNGYKKIGLVVSEIKELETEPKISIHFNSSESGPSGGLMMTLAIYNTITNGNITKGHKIAGTGTIDENGYVNSISGVEYKIKGVVRAKIKTFLVPNGDNYNEALKIKKENNYDIDIVPISHVSEAINYLEKNLSK